MDTLGLLARQLAVLAQMLAGHGSADRVGVDLGLGSPSRVALTACPEKVGAIKHVGRLELKILIARLGWQLCFAGSSVRRQGSLLVHLGGVDYHEAVQATRFALQADWLSLALPWLVLFAFLALVLVLAGRLRGTRSTRALSIAGVVMLAGAAGLTVVQQQRLGVELGQDKLVLDGLVRTRLEKSRVLGHRARIVDLDRQPSFEISRPLGIGLGWGQNSGWALLRNGMVVYALVGSGRRWLMVPTQDHYYLALAVQDLPGLQQRLADWSSTPKSERP